MVSVLPVKKQMPTPPHTPPPPHLFPNLPCKNQLVLPLPRLLKLAIHSSISLWLPFISPAFNTVFPSSYIYPYIQWKCIPISNESVSLYSMRVYPNIQWECIPIWSISNEMAGPSFFAHELPIVLAIHAKILRGKGGGGLLDLIEGLRPTSNSKPIFFLL